MEDLLFNKTRGTSKQNDKRFFLPSKSALCEGGGTDEGRKTKEIKQIHRPMFSPMRSGTLP